VRACALLVLLASGCPEDLVDPGPDFSAILLDLGGIDLTPNTDLRPPPPDLTPPPKLMVYVSGYSPQIAWFELNRDTGALTARGTLPVAGSPSWLAVHPDRRHLYAVDEAQVGLVRAFSIDAQGALSALGVAASSGGDGPAHASVDPQGKWLLVANYGDGKISVLKLNSDGSIGTPIQTRTAGDNAHQILADETSTHVFVPCKGGNFVAQYTFDPAMGMLLPNAPATVNASEAGAGPRHMILRGGFAYVIEENLSKMTAYTRDAQGRLLFLQSLSTVPPNFAGNNTGAEIVSSGSYLYGSNRGHDSIVQYTLGSDGRMTPVGYTKTGGQTPRSFTVDPTGRWLLAAGQDSDDVRVLSLDPQSGVPTQTTVQVSVPNPTFVGVVELPE
jgi:6-phosphogluconolactonase